MRASEGGIGYSDLMNMNYGEIFEINKEMSSLIEKENRDMKRG